MPQIYYFMASESKEENILRLILENSPLKQWHFTEIVQQAHVTKAVANKWLNKYLQESLLKKIKESKQFPYFTVGINNPQYYSRKRIYALEQLHHSGLIPKLLSLTKAKTIILFGSQINGDWYKDSDVDLFILGDISNFNKSPYELKLGKHIELHLFQNRTEIQKVKTGLIENIINGYLLKGRVQDVIGET